MPRETNFGIRDCGPAANHFCSGLIYMIRAKHTTKKSDRVALLGHADTDVRYTERAIADYPKCSIRESVVSTRAELNSLFTIYGSSAPRRSDPRVCGRRAGCLHHRRTGVRDAARKSERSARMTIDLATETIDEIIFRHAARKHSE